MPVHNSDISGIFNKTADLLEIKGENQYRISAYRNAARIVSTLSVSAADFREEGKDFSEIKGIGDDLAGKIEEILDTGTLKQLKDLEGEIPSSLSELMKISDLGPKMVKTLHEELEINTREELEKAAKEGKLEELEGFGKKTQEKILDTIEREKKSDIKGRFRIDKAEEAAISLVNYLKDQKGIKEIEIAGSYRRRKETVGDIDILATCKHGRDKEIMEKFVKYDDVEEVISHGKTRSSVILRNNLQVDLRVVQQKSYGAALLYFTGSKSHNVNLRQMALDKDWKMNEYGIFEGKKQIAGKTEKEMYEKIGLRYIEPELRENSGEIEASKNNKLPDLIKLKDIRGDLHTHTTASDGKYSIEEMAKAAKDKGYEYFAVSDHSKSLTVAKGLDEERLRKQIDEIDKLNDKIKNFRILKSIEVDIHENGSLDLDEEVLKKLDIVICSIHSKFKLSKKKQTGRVLKAMEHPCFNIFAHPTGRFVGEREPYEIDLKEVLKKAADNNCFLEINSQPRRLDLKDNLAKMAVESGVKLAISTDAHTTTNLDLIRYGVEQARRGWLRKEDVLNTYSWSDLKRMIKK
ncbi:MAG: DNA polymerase/3'-5' exonuclease PolX [Bacteroidota bacterium]